MELINEKLLKKIEDLNLDPILDFETMGEILGISGNTVKNIIDKDPEKYKRVLTGTYSSLDEYKKELEKIGCTFKKRTGEGSIRTEAVDKETGEKVGEIASARKRFGNLLGLEYLAEDYFNLEEIVNFSDYYGIIEENILNTILKENEELNSREAQKEMSKKIIIDNKYYDIIKEVEKLLENELTNEVEESYKKEIKRLNNKVKDLENKLTAIKNLIKH